MLAKFFKSNKFSAPLIKRIGISIALTIWVVVAFVLAQLLLTALLWALGRVGLTFDGINEVVLNTVVAAIMYMLAIGLVISVPLIIFKRTTSWEELGIKRWLSWMDILLAPIATVVYLLISATLTALAQKVPGFDTNLVQDIGFNNLANQSQYILAFVTLVVVAPIAEEVLFRGYLFGKIRKRLAFVPTLCLVSITFALLHLPGVNASGELQLQWNVTVDVFALSLILGSLREVTGNIWAGILLHALKNGLAFYFLFINPMMSTMGS